MPSVDAIQDAIGGAGRYQILNYCFVALSVTSAAFQVLNIVFVGASNPHTCQQPDNLSDIYNHIDNDNITIDNSIVQFEKCNIHVEANVSGVSYSSDLPCLHGYNYTNRKDRSLISDMDIVCDKAPLESLDQTLLVLGQGIGACTLTWFSDRYGRRTIILFSHTLFLFVGIGIGLVPTYTLFIVLRVVLGMCQQGIVLGNATMNVEMFTSRYRRLGIMFNSVIFTFSGCLIPLIAYLMRDYSWRYMQLAYCSVSLLVFVQFFTLNESLPWLITNGKSEKVVKILKKAARMEGKDEQEVLNVYRKYQEEAELERKIKEEEDKEMKYTSEEGSAGKKPKDPRNPSFLDMLKRKRLAVIVFVLWFSWFTCNITYFGLYMISDTLVGDHYINFMLLALVELPSELIFIFIIDRWGRKKTGIAVNSLAASALLTATAIKTWAVGDWAGPVVTVFTLIGMFGAISAWGVIILFTSELFPTNLRNFGIGTCEAFSTIGGMVAPFSRLLVQYVPWGPGAIFGGCCLIATFLYTLLPETMGREMPETLDDITRRGRNPDPDSSFTEASKLQTTTSNYDQQKGDNSQELATGGKEGNLKPKIN